MRVTDGLKLTTGPGSEVWEDVCVNMCTLFTAVQLGEHPDDGEPVQTNSGRFGPYVVHKTLYAPLPKDRTPQDITFEEAMELLAAKAARMRAKGKDPYAVRDKHICSCMETRSLFKIDAGGTPQKCLGLAKFYAMHERGYATCLDVQQRCTL